MFYIFSQDKEWVTPFGKNNSLVVDSTNDTIKLFFVSEEKTAILAEFETKKQCTACIREILDKYVDCGGNGYYEISFAKYYNY